MQYECEFENYNLDEKLGSVSADSGQLTTRTIQRER